MSDETTAENGGEFAENQGFSFDLIGENPHDSAPIQREYVPIKVVTREEHVKLSILEKVTRHAPRLSELIESYRLRREERIRAAIVNAVLASEVRYLNRDEILYLAWLKADYDQRMRENDEALRQRWQEKQRREHRRLFATPRRSSAPSNRWQVH